MFDRRSVFRLAALGASGAALSACGRTTGAAPGPQVGGGTLTYAIPVDPESWDPHSASTDVTGMVLRGVFDSLVAQRPDGSFAPWLARSWRVSENGRTYFFRLREDVTFSDGTPFDADAVRVNLEHIVAPETASRRAAGLLGPFEGAEVLGAFDVAVHFAQPYAGFLSAASTTFLGFHSPRALRQHAGDLGSGGVYTVGTGPFVFSAVSNGRRALFSRRADYRWAPETAGHNGPAHLQQLAVEIVPEDSSRSGAVLSGQVDVADKLPAERLAAIRTHPKLSLTTVMTPGAPYSFYLNTARPPFDELAVRHAVQCGIDVEAITAGVFLGEYQRAWSPLSPATHGYESGLESSWRYDPELARSLLDGAGFTGRDDEGYRIREGRRLSAQLPFVQSFVSAKDRTVNIGVQDELRRLGIELELVPLDSAASMGRTRSGDYGMFAFSWSGTDAGLLRMLFHSGQQFADGGVNGARVRDAELDALLDQAEATTDPAQATARLRQVQHRVVDEALVVPIYVPRRDVAIGPRVRGLGFDAHSWPNFYDAWVEQGR